MFFKFKREKPVEAPAAPPPASEQPVHRPEIVKELTLNRLFTRCHINIIQPCYIPNISSALDMSRMILGVCSNDWQLFSAFNRTASENFLAAVIWLFINHRPTGFKDGIALRHMIHFTRNEGMRSVTEDDLELFYKGWADFAATDSMGNVILDFIDKNGTNISNDGVDMDKRLKDLSYVDRLDRYVTIVRNWYLDKSHLETIPDTIMGRYSDLGHVLQFIFSPYEKMFDVLIDSDPQIQALTMPFVSAWENQSMDQLEQMMGTLRLVLSRLVSPLAYFLFTSGDDIHLLDRTEGVSYKLVITSDGYEGIATNNILRLYGTLAKSYGWKVEYKYSTRDKSVDSLPLLMKNFKKICSDTEELFKSTEKRRHDSDVPKREKDNEQPPTTAGSPLFDTSNIESPITDMYRSLANNKN